MQDRGEKIVSLAREILNSDRIPPLPAASTTGITLSFKMLFLATLLAASGASAVTAWSVGSHRPLNHYERTELNALVFYSAHQKNLSEEDMRRNILEKLKLTSFDAMTEHDFNAARSYLHTQID